MKYLLLILIPTLSFAQAKKDTKIIVTVTDTIGLSDKVARAFQLNEFSIDNKDAGFVSTKEKGIKAGLPTEVKLRAVIVGNQVTFTGEAKANISMLGQPATFDRIAFMGVKGSVYRASWDEMDKIAKSIDGQITYSK